MGTRNFIIYALVLLLGGASPDVSFAQTQTEEEIAKAMIGEITNSHGRDPREFSRMASELANFKYKEVVEALGNLIKTQLEQARPNSYVIGNSLTSLAAVGNKLAWEYLEGEFGDLETRISNKFDSPTSDHLLATLEQSKREMQNNTHELPSLFSNIEGEAPSLKKRPNESYADWIERLVIEGQDKDAATINSVTSHILNDSTVNKADGAGHSPQVFGREKEARELTEKLSRFKARTPVLVGPAGVGKTTVVLKLAEMIEQGEINSDKIFDGVRESIILETTPASISKLALSDTPVAQAAALEKFIKAIKNFQKKHDQKLIVFIDELHNLDKGQIEGLKPFLDSTRHGISFIGASTYSEFELKFKNNEAAQRRFSLIAVVEFTKSQILEIIEESWHPILRKTFNVQFSKEAIENVVSDAIAVQNPGGPIDTAIKTMQDIAIDTRAGNPNKKTAFKLSEDDVYGFLQERKRYPADPRDGPNFKSFMDQWKKQINEEVLGQEEAIERVLRNLSALLSDEKKRVSPVALLGPTGVGKTLLGNVIAEVVFDNPQAVHELDATAFKTGGLSLNSALGAPNGVVSNDQTSGSFIEWLQDPAKGKKGGVLIINEIERASKDFWERFMEFFDRGVIEGGDGKKRMANNLLVILTSNKGHEVLYPKGIHGWGQQEIKNHLNGFSQKNLRDLFSDLDPAVLGRIDEMILTNPINNDLAKRIAQKTVDDWAADYLKTQHIQAVVSKDFAEKLIDVDFDILEGARPIKRRIKHALNRAQEALYTWKLQRGDSIKIDLREGEAKNFILQVSYKKETIEVPTDLIPRIHPLDDPELKKKINNLEEMNKSIIGQEDMVKTIKDAVISHYSNNNKSRPLSLALIGSTGIGKTETGKALAKIWYGHEDRVETISLGHIQYTGQLNDIFGSPVGHVGAQDISPYEQALRNNAQGGVFIFDEFSNMGSKNPAEQDALAKSFYNMMDEGVWRSNATGQVYDLSRYVFLFTGNDGEKYFQNIPFDLQQRVWKKLKGREESAKILSEAGVPAAFIGRLSDVILARPLDEEDINQINRNFLAPLIQELKSRNIKLLIDADFEKALTQSFYIPTKGARSTKSFIDDVLVGYVNKFIIENQDKNIQQIKLTIDDNIPFDKRFEMIDQKRTIMLSLEALTEDGKSYNDAKDVTHKAASRPILTEESAKQITIHEAGHAIVGDTLKRKVDYISIRSNSEVGGFVNFDNTVIREINRKMVTFEVAIALAGRQAEVQNGHPLNLGWGQDLEAIKGIIGNFVSGHKDTNILFHQKKRKKKLPTLSAKEKQEAEQIFNHAKKLAGAILSEKKDQLEKLSNQLLEKTIMDGDEFRAFIAEHKVPAGELSKRIIRKIELLGELDIVLWGDGDNLSARFLQQHLSSPNLSKQVDSVEDLIPAMVKFIDQGGEETLRVLTEEVLTQKTWSKYPELVEALIKQANLERRHSIEQSLLSLEHWKKHPRLIELSKGGEVTLDNLVRGLKDVPRDC